MFQKDGLLFLFYSFDDLIFFSLLRYTHRESCYSFFCWFLFKSWFHSRYKNSWILQLKWWIFYSDYMNLIFISIVRKLQFVLFISKRNLCPISCESFFFIHFKHFNVLKNDFQSKCIHLQNVSCKTKSWKMRRKI